MEKDEMAGKVQTVLGIIDGESLGVTLVHEHLLLDLSMYFTEPGKSEQRSMAYEPVSLQNLSWIKGNSLYNLDNMKLTDEQLAINEALLFKLEGGKTIVDVTNQGPTGRNPQGLARIATATGLNVIMGTGYYVAAAHPPEILTMCEEEIAENIIRDIRTGVGNTGVRAGIIGEVGCSTPLEDSERKVLRGCAIAQQKTGAAIYIHPSHTDDLVLEIIDILGNAGANLSRTVIGHVDTCAFKDTTCSKLLNAGCCLAYDEFGFEGCILVNQKIFLEPPSDLQRIDKIRKHIDDGYLDQLLISQDVCDKIKLVTYGGFGYAHILRDILPIMRIKGITDKQIHTLMVETPKRILSFGNIKH